VRLLLERITLDGGRADWRVLRTESGIRPEGKDEG